MRHLVWTVSGCIISSLLLSPQIAGARDGKTSRVAQIASNTIDEAKSRAGDSAPDVKKNKSNQSDDAFSSVPVDFSTERVDSTGEGKDGTTEKAERAPKKKGKKSKNKQAQAKPGTEKTGEAKAGANKTDTAVATKEKPLAQKIPKYFQDAVTVQSVNLFDQAIKLYKMAIEDDPQYVSSYNNIAQCLLARGAEGDKAEAEQMLARALKLDPQNVGSLYVSAILKETKKDYCGAEDAYKKILSIQPLNMQAVQNLAELYFVQGKRAEARAVLVNVLKSKPPEQQKVIYEQALSNLDKTPTPQTQKKGKDQVSSKTSGTLANLDKSSKTQPAKSKSKSSKGKETGKPKTQL